MSLLSCFIFGVVVSAAPVIKGNVFATNTGVAFGGRACVDCCATTPRGSTPSDGSALQSVLAKHDCATPLAPNALDFRGEWFDTNASTTYLIEQCGSRVIFIGGGVVHDYLKTDGTLAGGVADVSRIDPKKPFFASAAWGKNEEIGTYALNVYATGDSRREIWWRENNHLRMHRGDSVALILERVTYEKLLIY